MNKAFLFDMDGVLIHSEPVWEELERKYFPKMFGNDVAERMPNLVGAGLARVLDLASSLGAVFDREDILSQYETLADEVYARAKATPGTDELIRSLQEEGFKLGVVSQTKERHIHKALEQLAAKDQLQVIISLHEHTELKPKPAPDGYLAALQALKADSVSSFVMEDSNLGIEAGKAAGCFVIGFKGSLMPGYSQKDADEYADTMAEVDEIVKRRTTQR